MLVSIHLRHTLIYLIFAACLLAQGCAPTVKPVFYPGEPDPPRYQFLQSITNESDISSSAIKKFLAESLFTFEKAYGIAAYKESLLVTDSHLKGYTVLNFKAGEMKFVNKDGTNQRSQMRSAFGITVDEQGNRFIGDMQARRVLMYSADDRYIKSFDFAEEDSSPMGLLAKDNKLYVTQLKQSRIDVLDINSGELLDSFQREEAQLAWPADIVQHNDSLYVVDMLRYRVLELSKNGEFKRDISEVGDSPGSLARPKGIAIDRQGRLLVLDAAFENFQVFNPEGELLGYIGSGGSDPENLHLPARICISYDLVPHFQKYAAPGFKLEYIVAIANQSGPSKINIYGFGKMAGKEYKN